MPHHQAAWAYHGDLFQPEAQAASGLSLFLEENDYGAY
jgi:hypothetical protein